MNWNEFAKEVHQVAVDHGWWETKPSFAEIVVMCHSELSEAVEEYRTGRPMVWHHCTFSNDPDCPCLAGQKDDCICKMADYPGQEEECQYYHEKPEGLAVELADCILRILDWFAAEGLDADDLIEKGPHRVRMEIHRVNGDKTMGPYAIARWHATISMAYAAYLICGNARSSGDRLARCVLEIMAWAKANSVDMEAVLRAKHEYNKTRPYRHGGKKL